MEGYFRLRHRTELQSFRRDPWRDLQHSSCLLSDLGSSSLGREGTGRSGQREAGPGRQDRFSSNAPIGTLRLLLLWITLLVFSRGILYCFMGITQERRTKSEYLLLSTRYGIITRSGTQS